MIKSGRTQLIAHVDSDLADRFRKMIDERGHKQKRLFEALLRLWIELPRNAQSTLLDNSIKEPMKALLKEVAEATPKSGGS